MNAPERIFIHPTERCPVSKAWNRGEWKNHDSGAHGDIEYIRADLVPQWQPIETAPRNTLVDIWVEAKLKGESGRRANMKLLPDGSWFGPANLYATDKVTHWMPRPTPPKLPASRRTAND